MNKTPVVLSLAVALCAISCFCAPITTPPPSSTPAPSVPVNEEAKVSSLSLADVEDVMMDPSAKLPWQKQEGDITYLTDKFLFPEDPDDPFFELPVTAEQRSKRAAVRNRYRLWPNGVVPYVISDAYTASEVKTIIKAMDHWEDHTCIRFVPRTTERDYVSFFPGGGCYSYVGRIGRNQGISVGRRCFAVYTAVHEIGHALGFYHEQSRPDRDEHVEIVYDNIVAGADSEFEKLSDTQVDSLGVGYDYNSIMHYDANLYSRNGNPTIIALDPEIPIGMARELSELDIEQTKRLYNCPTVPPPRSITAPNDDEEGLAFPSELPYPDCGAFISDLRGTIKSPGYPEYTHNANCAWLFKMDLTGFNILFDFAPLQVESSPDCESDYIQLYESLDTSGYTGGKKCGNYRYFPMSSLTSFARLEFHTNASNETPNLKGFELKYEAYDIDECNPLWKVCSHGCSNFEGGFECSCPEGFFMSSDGINCFDINECGLGDGGCDHKCVNRAGTYECACEDGYTLQGDNKTCVADGAGDPCVEARCEYRCQIVNNVAQCLCPNGFQVDTDGRSCVDKNECLNSNGYCQHICNNNVGSYTCSCNPGYDLVPDGYSCLPSNPCPVNNGGCEHTCSFTGVSRVCSCRSGYELASDGTSCNVIDPCAENNGGCQHSCTKSGDSRVCSCRPGYQLSSTDGTSCTDINECASNGGKGDCEHACSNTDGSRVCTCPAGYQLLPDGVSCEDIDECKTNNGDCGQLHCINQDGSHQCGCKEGFKLRGDGNGCAEILEGPSGRISSGNWPETYPVNVDLQWVVQCESHQAVDLTFSNGFGIAGSLPECTRDWLMVFDGDSTSAEVMGKFCHYAVPQVSRSSSSSVLIYFYAGPSHNSARKGFEVSYTCVDVAPRVTTTAAPVVRPVTPSEQPLELKPEATLPPQIPSEQPKPETTAPPTLPPTLPPQPAQCGQTLFTGSSGTIESPNYPQTYPTNLQCEYFIQLPDESSRVEISFSGFRIAGRYPECAKDWVKVYDGHTNDGNLHGTFCYTSLPSTITTSGSTAKIVLYAGPSHNPSRNGFSASYRTITS